MLTGPNASDDPKDDRNGGENDAKPDQYLSSLNEHAEEDHC